MRDHVTRVVENIIKARDTIEGILNKPIPEELVLDTLSEVEHIAIHELAHAAIRVAYPEVEELWHRDEVLGECVDEVAARVIEAYVSKRIGAYTHSFEEHLHELMHYTSLGNLGMTAEDLGTLYSEAENLLREGRLRDAVEVVVRRCRDWAAMPR